MNIKIRSSERERERELSYNKTSVLFLLSTFKCFILNMLFIINKKRTNYLKYLIDLKVINIYFSLRILFILFM